MVRARLIVRRNSAQKAIAVIVGHLAGPRQRRGGTIRPVPTPAIGRQDLRAEICAPRSGLSGSGRNRAAEVPEFRSEVPQLDVGTNPVRRGKVTALIDGRII